MKVSYGIVVGPGFNQQFLTNQICSIHRQYKEYFDEDYEIILIGDLGDYRPWNCHVIHFDETEKKGWITRKKNLIAQAALFDIVSITHDYYEYDRDWLQGMYKYKEVYHRDWNIMVNRVQNLDGTRHADWIVSPDILQHYLKYYQDVSEKLMATAPHENGAKFINSLPYDVTDLSHIQYISGGHILVKKKVLLDVKMNEELVWGNAEDVEWSKRLYLGGYNYVFNPFGLVKIQKPGKWKVTEMPYWMVEKLRKSYGSTV